jgi:hypothetical protein
VISLTCISRITSPSSKAADHIYQPVLRKHPSKSGQT